MAFDDEGEFSEAFARLDEELAERIRNGSAEAFERISGVVKDAGDTERHRRQRIEATKPQ